MVLRVVCSIDWPTRWVTESSRSDDRAGHFGLPPGQSLSHRVNAAGGFALGAQHFAQALLKLVGSDCLRHRQLRAAAAGARDHDGYGQQEDEGEYAKPDQRLAGVDRQGRRS